MHIKYNINHNNTQLTMRREGSHVWWYSPAWCRLQVCSSSQRQVSSRVHPIPRSHRSPEGMMLVVEKMIDNFGVRDDVAVIMMYWWFLLLNSIINWGFEVLYLPEDSIFAVQMSLHAICYEELWAVSVGTVVSHRYHPSLICMYSILQQFILKWYQE